MATTVNFNLTSWDAAPSQEEAALAAFALESGSILFFPALAFPFHQDERPLLQLTPTASKNITFNSYTAQVGGFQGPVETCRALQGLMSRYSTQAARLILQLFPKYSAMQTGMTSFRPVEAQGRVSDSYRKDDSLLHVDAFPSRPTAGKRLLRVFCNVNPEGVPRIWKSGESFENVAIQFLPEVSAYYPWLAKIRHKIGITKHVQTEYDHTMLQLHHAMKADQEYQRHVHQCECHFPSGSTWIVFSDQVSHAVLSGQHMMEQTFYLPVEALYRPETAPLSVLQRLTGKSLI